MEWAFAEFMRNQRVVKKAQEEVRRVVGNKSKVEKDDVKQVKYLECVVKQTLRLHSHFALSVPRETRSDVTLGGYYIPPNTTVFVNLWGIQRDPEFWERPESLYQRDLRATKLISNSQYVHELCLKFLVSSYYGSLF
ncbi:hypothetical protein K1719_045441 [Acacia pycnantha]|nr:hypothetical protein K1719_045441 [Acacia pycnantha]